MNCCDLLYFAQYAIGPIKQNLMRVCDCFELIYAKDGCNTGRFYCENGIYEITTGNAVIIPPGVRYRFECDCQGYIYLMGFTGCNYDFNSVPIIVMDNEGTGISRIVERMEKELEGRGYRRKYMLTLLLNIALISIFRTYTEFDCKKEIEADSFNYILRFIEAQSQNGIEIDKIAHMAGLSYHRFRHKFKEITGISPQQYIIRQRINFAKKLLATTKYSTSSIAMACCFRSIPQFITCFSRQEGLTPIKYRKIHQSELKLTEEIEKNKHPKI